MLGPNLPNNQLTDYAYFTHPSHQNQKLNKKFIPYPPAVHLHVSDPTGQPDIPGGMKNNEKSI